MLDNSGTALATANHHHAFAMAGRRLIEEIGGMAHRASQPTARAFRYMGFDPDAECDRVRDVALGRSRYVEAVIARRDIDHLFAETHAGKLLRNPAIVVGKLAPRCIGAVLVDKTVQALMDS